MDDVYVHISCFHQENLLITLFFEMLDTEKIDYKSIIFTGMLFTISFMLTNKERKEKQKYIDMCIGSPRIWEVSNQEFI